MKWRRGFFRLWVVLTVIWLAIGAVFGWLEYTSEPYISGNYVYHVKKDIIQELHYSDEGTVKLGVKQGKVISTTIEYAKNKTFICYYKKEFEEKFKKAGVKFIRRKYKEHDIEKWDSIKEGALMFISFPLGVLLVGAMFIWAVSGFRKTG